MDIYIYMKQPLVVVAVVLALLTVLVLLPVHCTGTGGGIPCRGRDRRHAIQAHIIYIMIDDILILMYIYIISFDSNKPWYMYMYSQMISSFYTFICMFKNVEIHHTPQGCAMTTILTGEVDPRHCHRWCLSWMDIGGRKDQSTDTTYHVHINIHLYMCIYIYRFMDSINIFT